MSELDFEMRGMIDSDYDYYNDHKAMSIEDIDYDRFESDYGVEQLSEAELNQF